MIGSTRRTSIIGPKAKVLTAPEKGVVVIPHKSAEYIKDRNT